MDKGLDVVYIKMVRGAKLYSDEALNTPKAAVELIGKHICEMDREILCVLNLTSDLKPINVHFASVGALNYTLAHPREMLKASILSNSAKMMLVHNHPSGNVSPSRDDIDITIRMKEIGELIGIQLVDHIIVGNNYENFYSFCKEGLLNTDEKVQLLKNNNRQR